MLHRTASRSFGEWADGSPDDPDILDRGRSLRSFRFEGFLLQPERQSLLKEGEPIRIGGRALDLLTALVERPGEIVSKRELLARAWPDIFVEEANLKVNIATVRRALGETIMTPRYIATVVGRGYRFIAAVHMFERPWAAPSFSDR